MINKSELSLWIFCIFFIFYKDGAKLNDENRPYEFGFTIDGQQHRHERKDANGIVQGEFGFITADGVYHVTVYATDENGRFKILSMRNIKISEPLDGLQVGSYTTKPLPIGQSISSTSSAASDQNIGFSTSAAVPQDVSTTKKPILPTTQSTVKQACAGCGYATKVASSTPKSKPTLDIRGPSGDVQIPSKGNQNLDVNGLRVVSYTTNPLPTSQYVSSTSSATINVNQNAALITSTSKPKPAVIENVQNVEVANLGEAVNKPAVITSQGFGNTVVSTTKKPILFTTQSTIKPACASCGYVTRVSSSTPKSESTPGFNEINLQSKINGSVGGLPGNVAGVPGNVAGLPGNLAGGYNAGLQTITSSNENQNLLNQQSVGGQQSNIPIIEGVPSVQNMPGYQGVTNQNTLQASVANDNQRYPIGLTPGNVGNLNGNVQTSVIQSVSSQSNLNVPNEQKQPQTFDANQNYQDTTSLNQNQFDSQSNLGGQNVAKQENQNIQSQGNQNIPHGENRGNQNIPSPGNQNVPYLTNQGEQNVPYPGKQENENIPSSGNQANIPSQNAPGETVPNQYIQGTSLQNQGQPQTSQTPSTNLQGQMDRATPKPHSIVDDIKVEDNAILVPNNPPIPIKDKYPGMKDGLPNGITPGDISDLLYKFNYTIGFHGHYEMGWRNGTKIGGYFVNGRDGISRVVTYVADELGYRPKFKLINLGYDSPLTPKEETEKSFGLQSFEFVWYPLK